MRIVRKSRSSLPTAIAVAGLVLLAACGSGSTSTPIPPPPPTTTGPVTVFPGTASVPLGATAQFSAFLASSPTASFTWSVSGGASNGTITTAANGNGIYTAPTTLPSPSSVEVTATSGSSSGTATINLVTPPAGGMVVNPAVVVVKAGTSATISATLNGNAVTPTWQVNGTTGGDGVHGIISASGVYTAPLTPPPGGSTTVTAESGGNSATATVVVVFSNASLAGQYAFSYSGEDSKGRLAVAGSFTANSATGAIVGVEDYNSQHLQTPQTQAITGTFSVNPDGSGTASVSNSAMSGTDTWNFTLVASPQGQTAPNALLTRFDSGATGSGTIEQQSPTQLQLSSFSGNYAFVLSGLGAKGVPIGMAGKVRADGFGTFPVNFAEEDINDNGTTTQGGTDTSLHGTYFLDASNPNTGRGVLTLVNTSAEIPGTFNFAFYIVDSTHLKVVETDTTPPQLSGDFYSAPNTNGSFSDSALKGSYALSLGGTSASGGQPAGVVGVFQSSGSGSVTGGLMDANGSGSLSDQSLTSSSYTIDSNLGRISMTLTFGTSTRNFAAYTTSSGMVTLVELDTDIVLTGLAYPQTGTSTPQGSFAVNLRGVPGTSGFSERDVIGQITIPSSLTAPVGNLGVNDSGKVTPGVSIESTSTIAAPVTEGRGTASLVTSPSTFGLAYYVVNSDSALLIETDGNRSAVGIITKQF